MILTAPFLLGRFLMEELDRRGDNYRSLPLTIAIEEDEKSFALPQVRDMEGPGRAVMWGFFLWAVGVLLTCVRSGK